MKAQDIKDIALIVSEIQNSSNLATVFVEDLPGNGRHMERRANGKITAADVKRANGVIIESRVNSVLADTLIKHGMQAKAEVSDDGHPFVAVSLMDGSEHGDSEDVMELSNFIKNQILNRAKTRSKEDKMKSGIAKVRVAADKAKAGIGSKQVNNLKAVIEEVSQNMK